MWIKLSEIKHVRSLPSIEAWNTDEPKYMGVMVISFGAQKHCRKKVWILLS